MVTEPSLSLAQNTSTGGSGLPLPRFVSLKSANVNMRVGPGRQFKVEWRYVKKGLPMEIIQEFENWRKVRDPQGDEGWILHSLLSGKRNVITNPGEIGSSSAAIEVRASASADAGITARLEPGIIAAVVSCQDAWCQISVKDVSGYVEKKNIWGVYPDELIEE